MRVDAGLKSDDPEFDRMVRDTIPGMAHFAGTGPKGKCCGDCTYLVTRIGAAGYGCDKYRQMMGKMLQAEIPRRTKSCRHFEQRKVTYAARTSDRR